MCFIANNHFIDTKLLFVFCRYVIECPNCGVIYRSRQYWYGNQDPVDTVVRTEIQHVWPGVRETSCFVYISDLDYIPFVKFNNTAKELLLFVTIYLVISRKNCLCFLQSNGFLKDNSNAAQRLLDGVNLVAQSVSELSVKPAKAVTSWLTDQIAPAYWKPNSLILVSDTQAPPSSVSTNSQVNTLVSRGMFTICGAVTQSMFAGHKIKLGQTYFLSPLALGQ